MLKEIVYQIMNGDIDVKEFSLPWELMVEDEFDENKECGKLYNEVFEAKIRLADQLGEDENPNVEHIIDHMSRITKILAFKMYDYGIAEGKNLTKD